MGCWRTDWRTANAIRGATLVTSSPRMNTASHSSISRIVGVRMGPRRKISSDPSNQLCLVIGHAGMEAVRTNQSAQGKVGFQRRARRANPDDTAIRHPFA